jgi:hypothetical protein
MSILLIFVGLIVIIAGVLGREFFTADPVAFSEFDSTPPKAARWLFIIVGLCFIGLGLALLTGATNINAN